MSNATHNFYKVTAQRTITIIPDTAAKRREYEEEVVRTFYLSNADLKETIDLLRIVVDARRIAPLTANNALTIKDTPERVAAAGRIIQAIDKARPEVVIDVELLEVNRTRLLEYGLQFASPTRRRPASTASPTSTATGLTLQNLRNLSQSDIILTNLPTLYYRLLKSDTNTRTLANPQLRTSEGVPAQARFGEQVPVPVTTFSPIATGGVAAAADHVVPLPEHRREHRHHAAHPSRRRRVAGAEGRGHQPLGHRLRRPADVRQPRDHDRRSGCVTARPTCSRA